jgi:hypothetical protein
MGPLASPAVPRLIQRVQDQEPEVRAAAIVAFRYMGPDRVQAVPALTQALADQTLVGADPQARVRVSDLAAQVLGKFGPAALPAVPALSGMLADTNSFTRQQVMLALWRISHDTNLVDRAALEVARAADPVTCKRFLDVLGAMGPAARPAVPVILGVMTNAANQTRTLDLRGAGRITLRKIAPEMAANLSGVPSAPP